MPFDAVFLTATAAELRARVVGCRIDRVHQPARDTILLQLRGPGGAQRLLFSAGSGRARVHLTAEQTENPAEPPMFCMLLRKHLIGARIAGITQPPMERLLDFALDCTDELGESVQRHLIAELMGRSANLILLGPDGRVTDCLRRVDFEDSEKRQVLPGLFYHLPPAMERENPLGCPEERIAALFAAQTAPKKLDEWLLGTFAGLSPLICRELSFDFCGDADCDLSALAPARRAALPGFLAGEFSKLAGPYRPTLFLQDGAPKDFSYRPIRQYGALWEAREYPDFSSLLDAFCAGRDRADQMRQRTLTLRKTVQNLCARAERKLAVRRKELEATADRESLRRMGDITTANLHAMTRGQTVLRATDFYDPEMREIEIPLQPQLSPQQNAARFYKEYARKKNAEKALAGLIAESERECDYFRSILDELGRAETARDALEIRAELADGGYVRGGDGKKRMKLPPSKPMEFRSSEGFPIYVGRNNRQNDQLTLKTAQKTDLWLHAQKIHGSHAVIACGGRRPGEETIAEAAALAAYYSQAREGQNVPVDFTSVRNVKKPAGAKPGMVIYDRYNTVYATPDPALAERLRAR